MGTGRADTFELAVRYQFYHTLAILFAGMLMQHYTAATLRYAVFLFTTGVALFSGSLYGLSLTGLTFLGMITPLGGLAFIAGWICLLLAVSKKQASLV